MEFKCYASLVGGTIVPGVDSTIFAVALSAFLLIGALKLTIEQLISLVILVKKLKATVLSSYSLETGKLQSPPIQAGSPLNSGAQE